MAKVHVNCPKCQANITLRIAGDQYKDYYDVKDAPPEDVEELDGDEIYCEECDGHFDLMVKVVTKPVAQVGFMTR